MRPAEVSHHDLSLSLETGERFAREWFGDAAVDALPRYARGKNKGKLKGKVRWTRVESRGYGRSRAAILEPGWIIEAEVFENTYDFRTTKWVRGETLLHSFSRWTPAAGA